MRYFVLFCSLSLLVFTTACTPDADTEYPLDNEDMRRAKRGSLTGGGLQLLGNKEQQSGHTGIGVNSYLWKASLDTISFMPLASVDPHGGVIITDWHEDANARGERFKLNVFILDTELRTDALKVTVFKQVKSSSDWQDANASKKVARQLEDKILTRARELKSAGLYD